MLYWFLHLTSGSSEKQKNDDSAKSDQSAGQEQDEYGGSTDEEPGDLRETAASTSLPPGQISIVECEAVPGFEKTPGEQ